GSRPDAPRGGDRRRALGRAVGRARRPDPAGPRSRADSGPGGGQMSAEPPPAVAGESHGSFRFGWIVLGIATFVVLGAAGTRAAPGALLLGIQADTGWSVSEIALAGAAGLLLLGLGGPASGILLDRYGVRPVAVGALLLTAVGMLGATVSRELWQLVL